MQKNRLKGYQISPQQEHLWLLQQSSQGFPYRAISALLLEGNLNVKVLKDALKDVINRHEILRTTFYCLPEMAIPVQVITDRHVPSIHEYDLSGLEPQTQDVKLEALFDEANQQPIDFEQDSLLHVSLVTLSSDKHMLLINISALCADTETLNSLMCEISRSYAACLHEEKISDEPMQYIIVSEWQNELLESEEGKTAREYWQKQDFSGIFTFKLPFENQLSGKIKFEPRLFNLNVHDSLLSKLRALVQHYNTSISTFLLTCWQILLWRLMRQSDIIIGTACDGRTDEELEEALGLFTKYLPLRCHLEEPIQFCQLLEQVDKLAHDIYEWQEGFTWKQIRASDKNDTEFYYCPICFEFDKVPDKCQNNQVTFSIYKHYACVDRFKIKLSCFEQDDSLSTEFHYDTNFFALENIKRLAGQFHKLLESVLNNPTAEIGELEILTDVERQQLLVKFNNTKTDFQTVRHGRLPPTSAALIAHNKKNENFSPLPATTYHLPPCIHQLFEEQTERTPDAVAVVFEEEHLTYRELNSCANQLAHHLQRLGVEPDDLVGICMERSLEMVVGLLGILKAGGAYVPIDPAYPSERLAFMLEDASVQVLLTQQRILEGLPDTKLWSNVVDRKDLEDKGDKGDRGEKVLCTNPTSYEHEMPVVCLDREWHEIAQQSEQNPNSRVTADNLAYVIYTSGSTGVPKGVMISHQSICNHMLWMQTSFPLTEEDKVLQKTPFSFDASIWEFWAPLLVGAQLLMARPGGHQDSGYLVKVIAQQQVTIFQLVPSLLRMFIEEEEKKTCRSLRRLFCGGETLSVDLKERYFANLDGELHNLYGPTEACIDAIFWTCQRGSSQQIVPIGRPIANTQIYLLDTHLQPVPVGVCGELFISGIGLARGYLNRPELTAERFIANPFSDEPGTRLYKTGDLARYLPNGYIEYLGRIDHQVKIRGFRIELSEIEAVLSQHQAVFQNVVIVREDVPGDKRLVAYVVLKQEPAVTPSDLRCFLKEQLPEYMIPSACVLMKTLPLTPNGKVDRQALPAPDQVKPQLEVAHQAPQTDLERTIHKVWQEALHVEEIGIHDNFFDLGGHSLLLAETHARLRKVLKLEFPMVVMFQYPTINSLAKYLGHGQSEQLDSQQNCEQMENRIASVKRRQQVIQEHRATQNQQKEVQSRWFKHIK